MKKYKIPAVDSRLAKTAPEALEVAKKFGGPVALKICSPDVAHKSDAGGVRLNLQKQPEIRKAFGEILASVEQKVPDAKIDGVTVSPMAAPGGVEVILGVIRDPQYGPALMFGLGGIFTEIYKDVQFCLLPASEDELKYMIKSIQGYPLLAGIRGQRPTDVKALLETMKNLGRLAIDYPEFDQIDLNPVLVYEKGVAVVDYRIYLK